MTAAAIAPTSAITATTIPAFTGASVARIRALRNHSKGASEMGNRLQTGLWAATLAIALLGWTPLGQAAGGAVAKVVPFAKVAGFAKNAGALSGHSASRRPKAGQIPILSTSG